MKHTCQDCGGPTSRGRAGRCHACWTNFRKRSTALRCPDCDGFKKDYKAARCWDCNVARRRSTLEWAGVVGDFNPAAFRRLRTRSDMEWTPRMISEALNGRVSEKAIRDWDNGRFRPQRWALDLVMGVLQQKRCACCQGLGYVDASDEMARNRERQRAWRSRQKEATA